MAFSKNIVFLILAAGSSSRLGQPKQLVHFQGKTLLQHTIGTALSTKAEVIVVLGAVAEQVKESLQQLPVQVVKNEAWATGMGSSISAGVRFVKNNRPNAEAVLLLVCDQYLLTQKTLDEIIEKWQTTQSQIIAAEYAGSYGVPALFSKPLFDELIRLDGPNGAKKVIKKHMAQTVFIPFEDGFYDVDTPTDLQRINDL